MKMTVPTARSPIAFDHHSTTYSENWIEGFRAIRDSGRPVAWTEAHGGFWILSRYEDVLKVARDDRRFSVAKVPHPDGTATGGALLPSYGPPSVPFELDPPEHRGYRALLAPLLTPQAVRRLLPRVETLVEAAIDDVIEAGQADLMMDIAEIVPARLTCELLGFDPADAAPLAEVMHKIVYIPPDSPQFGEVMEGFAWLDRRIDAALADRLADPRDDVVSYFVHARIGDDRVPLERAGQMVLQFIAGGVDTTGSFTSTALMWLHDHPDQRAWLQADLSRVPAAVEEMLRYFTTAQYAARTVMEPVEIGGQPMMPGDRVMMSWAAANHDPAHFPEPDEMRLDRRIGHHMAFGAGAHTCLGMHLGRLQANVMLREIIRRMPDYRVAPGGAVRYPSTGTINGWVSIPAAFTPGARASHRPEL